MRSKFAMKRRARCGVVLLLALALCMQLGGIPAVAAGGAGTANGTIDVWRWVRVDSQDDLPLRDGTGYRHPVLLLYEWNGGKYMVDGDKRTSGTPFQFARTDLPEGVAYGEKTFRTTENISHLELLYKGMDSSNGNAKQYNLVMDKKTDNGVLTSISYSGGGFAETQSNATSIDVLTPNTISSVSVAGGQVALFYNVSSDRDSLVRIDDDSGNVYTSRSWTWNMARFVMYVGYKETLSAIRSDCTIDSGQVANYDGFVYIEPGVTVTVERGGVLSISGVLYNNGTIKNKGGDVVVQKNACIEQLCIGDGVGGVICCDGGDLVILSGGRVSVGKTESYSSYKTEYGNGFVLRNGATCTNFGTLVVSCSAYVVSGATLDNRASGSMFFEYKPKSTYSGSLYSLSMASVASVDTYESLASYQNDTPKSTEMLYVGHDVLLQNEGSVYLGLWAKSIGGNEADGSGKIYVTSKALNYVTSFSLSNSLPGKWYDMLVKL